MLAAIGVAAGIISPEHRSWRRVVLFYLAGAMVMWAFALGPEVTWSGSRVPPDYGPYSLLLHLPDAQSIRVPSRAWLLATRRLCRLRCAWLGARRRGRWLIAPLALLMVADGWFVGPTMEVPTPLPLYIPPNALVLDLPISANYGNADAQYLAVVGNYRVVNGYSGYAPSHFAALRNALAGQRPEAFVPFRQRADLYVVARPDVEPHFVTWLESLP